MKKILISTTALLLFMAPGVQAQTPQEITNEVISAFENTSQADFSNTTQLDLNAQGLFQGVTFDMQYTSGDIELIKSGKAFALSSEGETFSITADKEKGNKIQSGDLLFPLDIKGEYSRNLLADFDLFRFAGKFSYTDVTVQNNSKLQNIVDGLLELSEPFTNKWIEVNIASLEEEFPELFEDFSETKENLLEEMDDVNITKEIQNVIASGVENGIITLTKQNHTYSVTAQQQEGMEIFGATIPQIIITTKNGVITQININGSVDAHTPIGSIDAQIRLESVFSYNKPTITWPEFEQHDWEITKVVKMFLEFTAESERISQQENIFWYGLEKDIPHTDLGENASYIKNISSDTQVQNALAYLLQSEQQENVKNFLHGYKKLDWKLRTRDILHLYATEQVELGYWGKDNLKEIFTDPYYTNSSPYRNREIASHIMKIIDEEYRYQPWDIDIDEKKVYRFNTRGDMILFWARVVHAQGLEE